MPIPDTAQGILYEMDSRDWLDFYVGVSQGPLVGDILEDYEQVQEFTIDLGIEATLAGLVIDQTPGRQPVMQDRVVGFHLSVIEEQQGHARFLGAGVREPIDLFFKTNFSRRRWKQQTIFVTVRDK